MGGTAARIGGNKLSCQDLLMDLLFSGFGQISASILIEVTPVQLAEDIVSEIGSGSCSLWEEGIV